MCHLPLTTRRGRSFNYKRLRFSPQSLNIKQVTINMHSYKVFKKYDMHDIATHFKAYDMHDVQTTWGIYE